MSKLKPGDIVEHATGTIGLVISRYPSPITQLQTWVDVLWHDGGVTHHHISDEDITVVTMEAA